MIILQLYNNNIMLDRPFQVVIADDDRDDHLFVEQAFQSSGFGSDVTSLIAQHSGAEEHRGGYLLPLVASRTINGCRIYWRCSIPRHVFLFHHFEIPVYSSCPLLITVAII